MANNFMSYTDATQVFTAVGERKQDVMQVTSFPTTDVIGGTIVQYLGPTTEDYTNGYFYQYNITDDIWEQIDVQPETPIFIGTQAEWDALSTAVKATYEMVNITDDESDPCVVVDTVTDGDMRAVTSNAVYDAIKELTDLILPDSMTHRFRGIISSTGGGSYNAVCSVPPYIADNYNITGVNYADITGIVHITSGISANFWQNCTISVSLGSYGTSSYANNNVIVEVTLVRKTS